MLYEVQILIYNTAATSFTLAPDNLRGFLKDALQKGNTKARSRTPGTKSTPNQAQQRSSNSLLLSFYTYILGISAFNLYSKNYLKKIYKLQLQLCYFTI